MLRIRAFSPGTLMVAIHWEASTREVTIRGSVGASEEDHLLGTAAVPAGTTRYQDRDDGVCVWIYKGSLNLSCQKLEPATCLDFVNL
jgi:hypothetical protein